VVRRAKSGMLRNKHLVPFGQLVEKRKPGWKAARAMDKNKRLAPPAAPQAHRDIAYAVLGLLRHHHSLPAVFFRMSGMALREKSIPRMVRARAAHGLQAISCLTGAR